MRSHATLPEGRDARWDVLLKAWQLCRRTKEQPTCSDFLEAVRVVMDAPNLPTRRIIRTFGYKWSRLVVCFEAGIPPWRHPRTNAADIYVQEPGRRLSVPPEIPTGIGSVDENGVTRILVPPKAVTGKSAWAALKSAAASYAEAADAIRDRLVEIDTDQPIGIVIMGDMHIGSVGVDYERLERIRDVVTENRNVFAVSIGDILDSMVWRSVMHEGRKSPVDFPGEVRAGAEFLRSLADTKRLIGICAGNHDLISGKLSGFGALDSVVEYVIPQIPYHPTQLDLTLRVGLATYKMTLRHAVPGNSQWNAAHAVHKWLRFCAEETDIVCAGHTHRSGCASIRHNGRDRIGVQVGAYKVNRFDDYALEHGFTDENANPDYMVLLWPNARKMKVLPTEDGLVLLRAASKHSVTPIKKATRSRGGKIARSGRSASRTAAQSPSRSKAPRRSRGR